MLEITLYGTSMDYESIKSQLKSILDNSVCTHLTLISGSIDDDILELLCQCVQLPSLTYLDLTQTQMHPDAWTKLFSALEKAENLATLDLSECNFEKNKAELTHMLTALTNLSQVKGLDDFDKKISVLIKQKCLFKQAEDYLIQCKKKHVTKLEELSECKVLFYPKIAKIQAEPTHDAKRLNILLAQFHLYLASQYNMLEEKEPAITYYEKILSPYIPLSFQQQAHIELGNIYYTEATLFENHFPSEVETKIDLLKNAEGHLSKASPGKTSALLPYVRRSLGESFLENTEDTCAESFKQKYKIVL